jgi:hypothetical protein
LFTPSFPTTRIYGACAASGLVELSPDGAKDDAQCTTTARLFRAGNARVKSARVAFEMHIIRLDA